MTIEEFFQPHIKRVRSYPLLFKYLTYDNGLKMLEYSNIQFTRATELNDKFDSNVSKINFDCVRCCAIDIRRDPEELVAAVKEKHGPEIESFGICSLGTSYNNYDLWTQYAKDDGICIGFDTTRTIKCLHKNNIKAFSFAVDYVYSTDQLIPWELYLYSEITKFEFLRQLFCTKNEKEWAVEKEVRIIYSQLLEKSEPFFRPTLYKSCFKYIYLKRDLDDEKYNKVVELIRDLKYNDVEVIRL